MGVLFYIVSFTLFNNEKNKFALWNINSLPGRLFIKVTLLGHGISFR